MAIPNATHSLPEIQVILPSQSPTALLGIRSIIYKPTADINDIIKSIE
jgi:hypothetical protein